MIMIESGKDILMISLLFLQLHGPRDDSGAIISWWKCGVSQQRRSGRVYNL